MEVARSIDQMEGRVACVTFVVPAMLELFERELELPFELYGDPSRQAYEAFGFGRGSIARVWLHPKVWARYARLLLGGWRPKRDGQDTLQLGGNAVLDAGGRLSWIYRSAGPEDRPDVKKFAAELASAAG